MKKLSEFYGQEKTTAILRASVIKKEPIHQLALVGDPPLAGEIAYAYERALNCEHPVKGDACGDCRHCFIYWREYKVYWHSTKEIIDDPHTAIFYSPEPRPGAMLFNLAKTAGEPVHTDVLPLLIHSLLNHETEVIETTNKLAATMGYKEFIKQYTTIFKNLIYLQNNVEIAEVEKIDVLKSLAQKIPKSILTSAIRLLWDSQDNEAIPDGTAMVIISILITELFHPKETQAIFVDFQEEPIILVDTTTSNVQSLSLEDMLEIASE